MRCKIFFLSIIFLFSVFAASARAELLWYDAYESGMKAFQSGNLNRAERMLIAAMKEQPDQGSRIKAYGTRFIRYFPDLYLGIVYIRQGRYEEGLKQLEKTKSAKLISRGDPEYSDLLTYSQMAEERLKPPAPAAVTDTTAARRSQEEAADMLEKSRALIAEGRLDEAKQVLQSALQKDPSSKSLVDVSVEITQKELELRSQQEREKAKQQFDLLMAQVNNEIANRQFGHARALLREASDLGLDEAAVASAAERIAAAEAPAPQTTGVQNVPSPEQDPIELQALTAFYSGDYHRAITQFERIAAEGRNSARVSFYLGCSHAALALAQQKADPSVLEKAKTYFSNVHKANPDYRYDSRYISPRILQLFRDSND